MPGTRLSMRKVREVLRLKHALGMSERLIAEAVGAGKSAVGEYIRRARVIGLTWPLPDWLGAHVNALSAIGGVPKAAVCDNLKAGITRPSRYEPGINRAYQDLADHYGFVVLPTRVRKPRDKAKVEVAVQIVERFVLA